MSDYLKYTLLSIDAWRSGQGGWDWNNWHRLEEDIYIAPDLSNRALIKFFRDDLNLINDKSKGKVSIEDDDYNIILQIRQTGEPIYALCYGMHDREESKNEIHN